MGSLVKYSNKQVICVMLGLLISIPRLRYTVKHVSGRRSMQLGGYRRTAVSLEARRTKELGIFRERGAARRMRHYRLLSL